MPDIAPEAIEALEAAILDTLWNQDADGLYTGNAAETALAFIRDAIHRDGDDADAIRQALGLRWRYIHHQQHYIPEGGGTGWRPVTSRSVVSEWQEAIP